MNSKRKGSGGERELLEILRGNGFPDAHRNDQRYVSGFHNPDISAELKGKPLHIEVKRVERLNLSEAMKQAVRDADGAAIPIVAHRRNREPWMITLRLDDLLKGGVIDGINAGNPPQGAGAV